MILPKKETTVAYRCPHCGGGIMSAVGLFTLSADMMKLKCDCGRSEMTITYSRDGKVRLNVPCIICAKPHNFTLNSSLFFGREIFTVPCPYSDINIAFVGHENHVKAELARTELQLLEILEENGVDSFEALHEEENEDEIFSDPQIHDIIMFVIRDLEEANEIHCRCESRFDASYGIEIGNDFIRVYCKTCGAERVIPAGSVLQANAFLNCESLTLE